MGKVYVGLSGEEGGHGLYYGTVLEYLLRRGQMIHEHNRVRHAEQYCGEGEFLIHRRKLFKLAFARADYGYELPARFGNAHVHFRRNGNAVLHGKVNYHGAGKGFNAHALVLKNALIVNIFCKAPYAVAAHFGLAAVAVEYLHAHVACFALAHENKAVRADARAAVAKLPCHFVKVFGVLILPVVGYNKVVAKTVQLRKNHFLTPPRVAALSCLYYIIFAPAAQRLFHA